MTALELRILPPGRPVRVHPVEEGLTLGRHPDNRIVIEDPKVSAFHGAIVRGPSGGLAYADLGSRNRTRLDSGRILEANETEDLRPGLRLLLGHTEVLVAERSTGTALEGGTAAHGLAADPPAEAPDDQRPRAALAEPEPESELRLAVAAPDLAEKAPATAERVRLETLRPRLLLLGSGGPRTVRMTEPDLIIGRSQRPESGVTCLVEEAGISGVHAAISLEHARFVLRDLGSRNGTLLDGEALLPRQARVLGRDALLRFGSIEALFLFDVDPGGRPFPFSRYEHALAVLVEEGRIPGSERRRLRHRMRRDGIHPGEELLIAGRVTPAAWIGALVKAPVHASNHGRRQRLATLVVLVAMGLVAVAVWWFRPR
jgi:pSer/pThr/pTyr-binding forkhead associated (FHA) protein